MQKTGFIAEGEKTVLMGHAGLSGFMNVSIAMLVIGFTVLLLMVQFELGSMGKLSGGRKWLLTPILGSGMVAFSIKLIVIVTLLNFPKQTKGAHLRAQQARPPHATVASRYAPSTMSQRAGASLMTSRSTGVVAL